MKEFVEFRIIMEYAHLLFRDDEGTNLGDTVKVVKIEKNDPRFNAIGELQKKARENNDLFFTCFDYRRSYTETEINNAKWFRYSRLVILSQQVRSAEPYMTKVLLAQYVDLGRSNCHHLS